MKKAIYWAPAILYMALIFYMSSFPAPEAAGAFPIYFDVKAIHIVEYGVLTYLLFFALDKTTEISFAWKIVFSIALSYLYGLMDELHQVFVPRRSAALIDTVANIIGVGFTAFLLALKNASTGREKNHPSS